MPDSATLTTPSGIAAGHPHGAVVVDLERDEVALVDADERRPGVERLLQLRLVVHLDEDVEAELAGQLVELDQLERVEHGGDEQHGVGAHQPGVGDVAGIDGEVLAQHRERRRRAGRFEVGHRAAEELLVGEHREARWRRRARSVARQLGGIEVAVEVALRRVSGA